MGGRTRGNSNEGERGGKEKGRDGGECKGMARDDHPQILSWLRGCTNTYSFVTISVQLIFSISSTTTHSNASHSFLLAYC